LFTNALYDTDAHGATTESFPLAPRPREAGFNTLDDYCPLELGKDAQNLILAFPAGVWCG
jgi:hypothetical protein